MSSYFHFRFERLENGNLREYLLIHSGPGRFRPEHFATIIEEDLQRHLMPDSVIVLAPDFNFNAVKELFKTDATIGASFERIKRNVDIKLVGFDIEGRESQTFSVRGCGGREPDISEFIRPGITHIFQTHGGFVESTETYHFVNPSGRHTRRFIRLSNILINAGEISFIAFSCLRYLGASVERLFIDTPAAFSVTYAINEIRQGFSVEAIEVENFHSYDGHHKIDTVAGERGVVLVSASSSGGLASKLQAQNGFDTADIVHLLFLGNKACSFPVICDLSYDPKANPSGFSTAPDVYEPDSCLMCRNESHQVHLKGDQFDMRGPQPQPLTITKPDAPPSLSETMKRMAGKGALNVRVAPKSDQRSRDYFIDTDRLIDSTDFKARLEYTMRRVIPAATGYVIQADNSSKKFAEQIVTHIKSCGGSCKLIDAENVASIVSTENSSIVIAAAAIESGRCLTDISRDLRMVAPKTPQTYLIGVEKTTGTQRRENLKKTLIQTSERPFHEYASVESLILPSSSISNPWNEELEFLQRPETKAAFKGPLEKWHDERVELLSKSTPLNEKLFLRTTSGTELKLQDGFVFWPSHLPNKPHSQADVFYTISSVLQKLRTNSERPDQSQSIKSSWFHQTVIDPSNFGRFNDDIVQACLVRAATRAELNYRESPAESREIARIVSRILRAHNKPQGGAAPELMLAIATGRLGMCPDDRTNVLAEAEVQGGILKAFALSARPTSPAPFRSPPQTE